MQVDVEFEFFCTVKKHIGTILFSFIKKEKKSKFDKIPLIRIATSAVPAKRTLEAQ